MRAEAEVVRYRVAPRRDVACPTLSLAVFADLHACWPYMTEARINDLVAQTNGLGADAILLLGDYAGHVLGARSLAPELVAACLAKLDAPFGVYAVFGNHDWKDDPVARKARALSTKWHRAFEDSGLTCLINRGLDIDHPTGRLHLAGLESQQAFGTYRQDDVGNHDLEAIRSGLPQDVFTVMMAHEPDVFPELDMDIDLMISGHTHAGQIRLGGNSYYVPSRHGTRYAHGHFEEGDRQLLVSAGLGYSALPIRWRCPPELVVVEIGSDQPLF